MISNQIITINSRKFDQSIRRSWQCSLIKETINYYLFLGEFNEEIKHKDLGIIRPKTISYEYYWKHEYFNVFRFLEPDGKFRNYYCNINTPPTFAGNTLDYVDLDIDVLVRKDFSIEILDLDEYESNRKTYNYPQKLQNIVEESIEKLLAKIKRREFPFDLNN